MIPIERFYRDLVAIERVQAIQGELAVVEDTLYRAEDAQELLYLTRAGRFLQLAARALKEAQAEARTHCQPDLLQAQLKASIELVGQSPERMRREQKA